MNSRNEIPTHDGSLSREQLTWRRSIVARGFAIIQEVFGEGEISVLRDELSNAPLLRSRAGVRHILGNADVAKFAKDPRLMEVARVLLGGEARPFRATLFDKSPTANWLVVWHQDTALPLRERLEVPGWGPWSVKDGVSAKTLPKTNLCIVVLFRFTANECKLCQVRGSHCVVRFLISSRNVKASTSTP